MADTTTELEVLDQIVDVLGGQSGQYETVVPTLQQILALLGGGGGRGGYNPSLSVGRADALTGADSTAQWAQRTSEGSGSATVRSVQGAAVVQDGALVPVQIAGIQSKDAQGGELDSVEWEAQTLRAAGSVRDELTADELVTRVGVVDMGTLNWEWFSNLSVFLCNNLTDRLIGASTASVCTKYGDSLATSSSAQISAAPDKTLMCSTSNVNIFVKDSTYGTDAVAFKAAMSGELMFYTIANPTTTPISPELPMTYRVQAGGSESIIVPDGEISAAPLITLAEGESVADVVMDALACIAAPDGPTATANHAQNTYLTMGGKLYKVTSAIAVGETITPNTNVTETTVMAELIARTA